MFCIACTSNCIGQSFYVGSTGPYCGRCWNESHGDARIATLKRELAEALESVSDYYESEQDAHAERKKMMRERNEALIECGRLSEALKRATYARLDVLDR